MGPLQRCSQRRAAVPLLRARPRRPAAGGPGAQRGHPTRLRRAAVHGAVPGSVPRRFDPNSSGRGPPCRTTSGRRPGGVERLRRLRARLVHQEAIRRAFGYSVFGTGTRHVAFLRWLWGRCWTAEDPPAQLVDLATGWLVEHQVLLPGFSVLQRLCARARDRAERRLWRLLARQLTPEQARRLDRLLVVGDQDAARSWSCSGARLANPRSPAWCRPWDAWQRSRASAVIASVPTSSPPDASTAWPPRRSRSGPSASPAALRCTVGPPWRRSPIGSMPVPTTTSWTSCYSCSGSRRAESSASARPIVSAPWASSTPPHCCWPRPPGCCSTRPSPIPGSAWRCSPSWPGPSSRRRSPPSSGS